MSMPSSALLENVTKLNDTNFLSWWPQVQKVLVTIDADEIVDGTEKAPAESEATYKAWKTANKKACTIMWSCTEPQWQHLYDDVTLGSRAYANLKAKFAASNFGRRVTLRQAFYGCEHDPSKPVDIFVQKALHGRAQLKAIGIDIDDACVKDVILMNLDPSYHAIKTSLLTQTAEPSLETVRNILTSSANNIVSADIISVKSEPGDVALLARGRSKPHASKSQFSSVGGGRPGGNRGSSGGGDRGNSGGGKRDLTGFTWCDPSNEGCCFRCGRPGHFATRCPTSMPSEIRDWLKESDGHTEHSMWVRTRSSHSSSRSQSPPHPHSPTNHAHFAARSPSPSSSYYDSS